jgi:hypothetical protein
MRTKERDSEAIAEARQVYAKAAAGMRSAAAALVVVERRLRRAVKTAEIVAADPEGREPYTVEGWIAGLIGDCDLRDLREIANRFADAARQNWRRVVKAEAQRAAREYTRQEAMKAQLHELATKIRTGIQAAESVSAPRAEFRALTERIVSLCRAGAAGVGHLGFTTEEFLELRSERPANAKKTATHAAGN